MDKDDLKHATIVPRGQHTISRKRIDSHALKVLYRLNQGGYDAFLVGGCVRDLLLDHTPKDFDIATNATPEDVRKLFRNCRLIGRRFRLAHVHFGQKIIEVATFRAGGNKNTEDSRQTRGGMILRDNTYGNIEEDAFRRDFTINALYYNIRDFTLVDFVDGMSDIKSAHIRIIGDPEKRYREDPVRMIRAIRFAAKLGMTISDETATPIKALGELIYQTPPSRLFDEIIKLFHTGHATNVIPLLDQFGLLQVLFPETHEAVSADNRLYAMLLQACRDTDKRVAMDKPISIGFLYAILLWPAIEMRWQEYFDNQIPEMHALYQACRDVLQHQTDIINISKRFMHQIHDIWHLQYRLMRQNPSSVFRCLANTRFRAAFDLLCLRAKVNPALKPLAKWWTTFQTLDDDGMQDALTQMPKTPLH
jgi:poly(A) polymerase